MKLGQWGTAQIQDKGIEKDIPTKHKRQDYKTNEDIWSELNVNPVVKKIENYSNEQIQLVQRMDRDCHTSFWNINRVSNEANHNPQKTSRLLMV
jgi:hypothetical protein